MDVFNPHQIYFKIYAAQKMKLFFKKNQTKFEKDTLKKVERLDLDTLFKKYKEYVFNTLENRAGQEAAEELFSNIFMTVKKELPLFIPQTEYSYQAWIKKIIIYAIKNYHRKITAKKRISPDKLLSVNTGKHKKFLVNRHKEQLKTQEKKKFITNLIAGIPEDEIRELLEAIYYAGKSIQQYANDKNISPDTVRGKIFRFRKKNKNYNYDCEM